MKIWRRGFSLLLAFIMCISLLPAQAFAADELPEEIPADTTDNLPENEQAHTHSFSAAVTAPSCTEAGYTTYFCDCGESYTDDYTEPTGHSPEESAEIESTCESAGRTAGVICAVCGEILEGCEEIPATGHSPENVPEIPAEPETPGRTAGVVCAVCGEVLEGCEEIPASEDEEDADSQQEPQTETDSEAEVEEDEELPFALNPEKNYIQIQPEQEDGNRELVVYFSLPEAKDTETDTVQLRLPNGAELTLAGDEADGTEEGLHRLSHLEETDTWSAPLSELIGELHFSLRLNGGNMDEVQGEIVRQSDTGERRCALDVLKATTAATVFAAEGGEDEQDSDEGENQSFYKLNVTSGYDKNKTIWFEVSGPTNSTVRVYINDEYYASVQTDHLGYATAEYTLEDWAPNTTKWIRLEGGDEQAGEKLLHRTFSYYRRADDPVLMSFLYYDHAGSTDAVDLKESISGRSQATIEYTGNNDPCVIEIQYSSPEQISRVYVTATRGNESNTLIAQYQEETDRWVASGYLLSGSKRTLPERISVGYTTAHGAEGSRNVDVSADGDLYKVISAETLISSVEAGADNTEALQEYLVYFDFFDEDPEVVLGKTMKCVVELIDTKTGLEICDSYSGIVNAFSYVVPGLDSDRYIGIDGSDPYHLVITMVDLSDTLNSAVQYKLSCTDASSSEFMKIFDLAESLESVTTIMGTVSDMADVIKDSNALRDDINNADLTEDELSELLAKADEYQSDKSAFILLTTVLPIIAETGAMTAPGVVLGGMLSVLGLVSDAFYEKRLSDIRKELVETGWNVSDETKVSGSDGLTYSVSYTMQDASISEYVGIGAVTEKQWIYRIGVDVDGIMVSGNGASTVSLDEVIRQTLESIEPPEGFSVIELNKYKVDSVIYEEGVTEAPRLGRQVNHLVLPSTMAALPDLAYPGVFTSLGGPETKADLQIGWSVIPDGTFAGWNLQTVTLPGVTSIGQDAFRNCSQLQYFEHGERLTEIGYNAFAGCTSLTSFTIPASIETLGGAVFADSGVETIQVEPGVTKLEGNVFYNASSLREICLPETLKIFNCRFSGCGKLESFVAEGEDLAIKDAGLFRDCPLLNHVLFSGKWNTVGAPVDVFENCPLMKTAGPQGEDGYNLQFGWIEAVPDYYFAGMQLESYVLPEGLKSVGVFAFGNSNIKAEEIPTSVKSFGVAAMEGTGISAFTFSEGVVLIPRDMFKGCAALSRVVIPDTVTEIGSEAFCDCSSLTDITLSSSLKTIGSKAFANCKQLADITLPNSLEALGTGAFYACEKLTSITIPASLQSVPGAEDPTNSFIWTTDGCFANTGLKTVTVAEGQETIPSLLFAGTDQLESISLPSTLKKIDVRAFYGSGLSEIRLPENVVSLEERSFENCESLRNVYLNRNLKEMHYRLFKGCTSLTMIYFPGTEQEFDADVTIYTPFDGWDLSMMHYTDSAECTISFDANGGENAPEPIRALKNKKITLPEDIPTREGYVFDGWKPDGGYVSYDAGDSFTVTGDVTFHALWLKAGKCTVTFDANGGENPPAPVTGDSQTVITLPSRAGTMFRSTSIPCSLGIRCM